MTVFIPKSMNTLLFSVYLSIYIGRECSYVRVHKSRCNICFFVLCFTSVFCDGTRSSFTREELMNIRVTSPEVKKQELFSSAVLCFTETWLCGSCMEIKTKLTRSSSCLCHLYCDLVTQWLSCDTLPAERARFHLQVDYRLSVWQEAAYEHTKNILYYLTTEGLPVIDASVTGRAVIFTEKTKQN